MKKFLILMLPLIWLIGCKPSTKKQELKKNVVTVSILPQQYFVNKIAGDLLEVNVMIPPGASPVTYEPTPKQMQELSKSFAYFRIGHIEFEKSWMKNFENMNPDMKVINTSVNANLIEPEHDHGEHDDHHHEGHHHHHGIDPHIWTSPKEVKKQAELMYQFLVNELPEQKDIFEKNYNQFVIEIDSLDNYLSTVLTPYKGKKFLIFHPALSYIARDFGLEQISIEIDGKEPTPANVQEIVSIARKEQIKIVFVQKQFSTHNAEVIANEINGNVVQIDPLDPDWAEGIKNIADQIVKSYSTEL